MPSINENTDGLNINDSQLSLNPYEKDVFDADKFNQEHAQIY